MKHNEQFNKKNLFNASCIALIVTSMTFAVRAKLETVFGPGGYELSLQQIGSAFAPAFWGFTLAMIIGGPLIDIFGMKRIVWLAFGGHFVGIIITLLASDFWMLFFGTLAIGIGNGMVEAALNPLVATLYPNDKTKMLNRFHMWFPGGIVIGSIVAYLMMDVLNLSWQLMLVVLFVPLIIYSYMFLGEKLPKTERVLSGVSTSGMWLAILKPLFLFIAFCMILTASTELGTNQRIEGLLKYTGVPGILVLGFINGIMVIGRSFAGTFVRHLSTTGMLLFSAIFSFIGLYSLSWSSAGYTLLNFSQEYTVFIAAGIFGIGICFFWPTMLGFVAEKIPESGALGLSIMGGIGMFSVSIILPIIGDFMNLSSYLTIYYMSILPLILIFLFLGLHLFLKRR